MRLNIINIKNAVKGTVINSINKLSGVSVNGVSIDSRCIKKGNLFIAICGEKFDGHDFLSEVIRKGAVALIVNNHECLNKIESDLRRKVVIIYVRDTVRSFGYVANLHRSQFNIPVIAITGSAGKTTTKDLLGSVMAAKYKVLKNFKNENNHIGVPKTLLKIRPGVQIVVIECGTNQPGDMHWLSRIIQPSVVIYTNIGESHLERLKSLRGVFCEKIKLLKWLSADGIVLYNKDDLVLRRLEDRKDIRTLVSFSSHEAADFKAVLGESGRGLTTCFKLQRHEIKMRTPARHNIYTALAAIACARQFKISYKDIIERIERYKFGSNRQEIKKINGVLCIDDTYNSNPVSLKSAIQTLDNIKSRGKRILVCGDMLELGEREEVFHQRMGYLISKSKLDGLITFGKRSKNIQQIVSKKREDIVAEHCKTLTDLNRRLQKYLTPGNAILVKGSRGMRMERVITLLSRKVGKITADKVRHNKAGNC